MNDQLEKLQEFLDYRGYSQHSLSQYETMYRKSVDDKFIIKIVHSLANDLFRIRVKLDLIDDAALNITVAVGGTDNFMQQFNQLEKSIIFSVNRFPYEVQQPELNKLTPFQSIDG